MIKNYYTKIKKFILKQIPKIKDFFNRYKKPVRIVFYVISFIIIFLLCLELTLRYLTPTDFIKNKITAAVSQNCNADLELGKIRAGLSGVEIKNVYITSEGENIASARRVLLKLSFPSVFKRRFNVNKVLVEGVKLNILRDKNGVFNFERILPAETQGDKKQQGSASSGAPLIKLLVQRIRIDGSQIIFTDEVEDIKINVSSLGLDVEDFNFDKPFLITLNAIFSLGYKNMEAADINVGFSVNADFASFNFEKAFVEIKDLIASFNTSSLYLRGKIVNFNAPKIVFNTGTHRLVSESFKEIIPDLPEFDLTSFKTNTSLNVDLPSQKITINSFNLNTVFTDINAEGYLKAGQTLEYDIKTQGMLTLAQLPDALPMAAEYKPQGAVEWDLKAEANDISGALAFKDIAAFLPQAGDLNEVNAEVNIKSVKDISMPELKGKLNKRDFYAKVKFLMTDTAGSLDVIFKAQRLFINPTAEVRKQMFAPASAKEDAKAEEKIKESLEQTQRRITEKLGLPPFRIKLDFDVKSLDAPLISAENVKFKANMKDVTIMLDKVRGNMSLNASDGQIKDIYTITNANAVTRVLFMSVNVVSRVINSLNVIGVLKGLAGNVASVTGISGSKDESEDIDYSSEDGSYKIKGKMDFDIFATALDFNGGKTTIKQGSFVSELLSFKLAGDMNFNTRDIKMTVNAAPGRHKEEGIMPLTIKIGGTIDEPQGSMSMLSSVASLLKGTLLNNPASNLIKSGVVSLYNDNGEEVATPEEAAEEFDQK
ncbi:Uncharacterized protein involved in outer membrane biogenesis [Elusimicrobium minutum Pei191]|uniref:Uncharacterized protein involved in outer membrane biogenesis n=1 Tax=Elusimicrobium minutum (strain Pei191) TaxID=445932 RepID=B2KD73_ELUMP|nr:AsmA family protein [Elusimicrobium minutum]ACC98469.1 Uncharacterized protein involved in outer membrane biogenesis [Elusimicrobium minutum Pei191]